MKRIRRISLFFILEILAFAAGIYANALYIKSFYPNKLQNKEFILYEEKSEEPPKVKQTGFHSGSVITCDTAFSIEEYDVDKAVSSFHMDCIPGKYIGMNREEMVEAMELYSLSPPLSEQENGLLSVEVLSFSEDEVKIRKNYRKELSNNSFTGEKMKETCFFLVCENNYITVYRDDMNHIYLYTDIPMKNLPESLQEEIIQKKLIQGEGELYHFLESYSS